MCPPSCGGQAYLLLQCKELVLQALALQRLQLLLSLQLMPHGVLCCAQCSNLQPLSLAEVSPVIAGCLTLTGMHLLSAKAVPESKMCRQA